MNIYLTCLIELFCLIGLIAFVLRLALLKLSKTKSRHFRNIAFISEALGDDNHKIENKYTVFKKHRLFLSPISKMDENFIFILSVYKYLNEEVHKSHTLPASAEWLLDNFYIIEDQIKGLRSELNPKDYYRLPMLREGEYKNFARIYAVIAKLAAQTDGQMDESVLLKHLNSYQTHNVLYNRELCAIPIMLKLTFIENIRNLCENIHKTHCQWRKAEEIFYEWLNNEREDTKKIIKAFQDNLKSFEEVNYSFIEHLLYLLKRSGRSYTAVLGSLNEIMVKNGLSEQRIIQHEHNLQSVNTVSMGNNITSLRYFSTFEWSELFDSASKVEQILRDDPDGTYPKMDDTTRNHYRGKIEELAAHYCVSETEIAKEAILLTQKACFSSDISNTQSQLVKRTWHVGYYLISDGINILKNSFEPLKRIKANPGTLDNSLKRAIYLGSIFMITFILTFVAVHYSILTSATNRILLSILAGLAVLVPASEIAVSIVNRIVCNVLPPAFFPRLALKEGIPESLSTIVAIPTLLTNKKRVNELLSSLETHYLSNREDHLYFALIGAFRDADQADMYDDSDIIEAALHGIKKLNRKYCCNGPDKFYFFHRRRQYNESNNKWIGWERKRGALMEFNDFVLGSAQTSFAYFSCKTPPFSKVKYIITLDNDTVLPIGAAKKLIGTMAHPLHIPVIDDTKKMITSGYGIMQPRVEVDIESANRSLYSRIFSGQDGIDPYANAVSDVYQDLFEEGIFTGKGIYDLRSFQMVLKGTLPENAILSHDLLEGSYARTGLITDIKLVDSAPTRYNSFCTRLHRWVRGDWQLLPLLGQPLSLISKWKIFDNLRRSLIAPWLMLLALLSFMVLPGNTFIWLIFFMVASLFPFILNAVLCVFAFFQKNSKTKRHMPVMCGVKAPVFQGFLTFAFLPYQAGYMLHAIFITLTRILITKKNLLEWVPSADVELFQKNSLKSYIFKMMAALISAPVLVILSAVFKPQGIIFSLVFFIIWLSSPLIAYFISNDLKEPVQRFSKQDMDGLGITARKTWRFFEEFANANNNYLAPDNYQEDPPRGIAYRTSPTNIGLGLLSTLTARDLGYIGTHRMIDLIDKTVSTIEKLPKWNGHLYNWYNTNTLKPLRPISVSTVDSGNLAGYLITLKQGLIGYLNSPLIDNKFLSGIYDTFHCAGVHEANINEKIRTCTSNDPYLLNETLSALINTSQFKQIKAGAWKSKIGQMIGMFKKEISEFMPATDLLNKVPFNLINKNEDREIAVEAYRITAQLKQNHKLCDLHKTYISVHNDVATLMKNIKQLQKEYYNDVLTWLRQLNEKLIKGIVKIGFFIEKYNTLLERIDAISREMIFTPLYDKKKQLFYIGYDITADKPTDSHYDLLASEVRQTSYISVARGEVDSSHWHKLGRALTTMDRYKGLISWTGTMFEYFMPLLIMKNYKNTLLDETYSFVIRSQKKYAKERNMPWGVSESGFNSLDSSFDYQYKAIGIPWMGLKRGLIQDAVSAPYATFLALGLDAPGALENIKKLKEYGLDGNYGFYEAIDFTPERLPFKTQYAVVKSFMAHHQGMSLVAMDNFFNHNIMQERFHADPEMHAARLLLQEKVPQNLVITKETKEKVIPFKQSFSKERSPVRKFDMPNPVLPKSHILSNGNYSVMLTDRGSGYSKNKMLQVNRWRADNVLHFYGIFFYLRNVETNHIWSAAYSPLDHLPKLYKVTFTADKAVYERTDENIRTKTEVVVASGDNVEIRRISLKNTGKKACTIEVTSYFEVVLASQSADVSHPAFSNLFVETEFLSDKKCIIARRRPRSDMDNYLWLAHSVNVRDNTVGDLQFETDRMQFIGRGNTAKTAQVIRHNKHLIGNEGSVLDPIMSLRVSVNIEPGKTSEISFSTVVSYSNELLLELVNKYASADAVESAFKAAFTRSLADTKYQNLTASQLELYQEMISQILFISPLRKMNQELIAQNKRGQSSLWKYSISGDFPIVLAVINKSDHLAILYELLKAYEYWRLMDLNVNLVILCTETYDYDFSLHNLVLEIVSSSHIHNNPARQKEIFILDSANIPAEDINLLYAVARIIVNSHNGSLSEQIYIPNHNTLPPSRHPDSLPKRFDYPEIELPEMLYFNGLGGFSLDGSEYIIKLEKGQNTPAPWVNVIANPKFGFIATEAGSGYTWYENSHKNKLTPWSNDPVTDNPGEVLYISDRDTGELWTATALPIREQQSYIVRHGLGYSVFEHTSHGIKQKLTQYVPVDSPVKVSILTLKNLTNEQRHLALTYYIHPVLGVNEQVTGMHIKTSRGESGALLMENAYNHNMKDKICFMNVSVPERMATGDRNAFFGTGDIRSPQSLLQESLTESMGTGIDSCGVLQVHITLNANEECDIIFLLGVAENEKEIRILSEELFQLNKAKNSLEEAKNFWKEKTGVLKVNTPSGSMDLMLNGWLIYQVMSCRLWAKTAFYQAGGAFGFRDQLQDCLAIAQISPKTAREQILLHAKHQFIQGDVQHWWHEPDGDGIRTRFSDDMLWLPYVTSEYIRITGDYEILKEEISFLEGESLLEFEAERYGQSSIANVKSSLYDHCLRAINIALKFGIHGLPLMGTGDWNDGMNAVGKKGLGESVWLGWFLSAILKKFSDICDRAGDKELSIKYLRIKEELTQAIEQNAWDGSWYRRAYFDNGQVLGSIENREGKIDSIAQTWAVISEEGDPQRIKQAMHSLEDYLVMPDEGLIKLLTPPFNKGDLEPGYIKGYLPGIRENGGQYTHAAAWVIIAFAKMGDGDKSMEFFELINPVTHTENHREYSHYKVEPYVMAADVYAADSHIGRGGWTWYTGAAGWMYRAGLEYILGFQKNGNTLILEPCIPCKWKEYTIEYVFSDTLYSIHVKNPSAVNTGVKNVILDRHEMEGNRVILANDKKHHHIEVIMG